MKNNKNRNTLFTAIAISAVILVCLGVVSQFTTTTSEINTDNKAKSQNNDDLSKISIEDVLDINPNAVLNNENNQSSNSDSNLESELIDNSENKYESESPDTAKVQNDENDNSITVSVDGYDLANATWPVSSKEIVMDYSYNTTPVYSKTYNEYRSDHTGIDIKASENEEVKCAYAGKVVEITNDDRLGKLVKVEHTQGIYSIYANLAEDVNVTLNQRVSEGDVIGYVGNSASAESAEGTHLHFGVIAFSDYVNPSEYIKVK